MSRNRARIAILSELLAFPSITSKNWVNTDFSEEKAQPGDLVSLNLAPATKFYLSWLREWGWNGGPRYLLESIEDGELCWWGNVGISFYDRKQVEQRPKWKWDDEQFGFNDKWHEVFRNNSAYMVLPRLPVFGEDGSVELNVRIRFGEGDYQNPRTFPNWKKLGMKEMDSYYKDCVAGYENCIVVKTVNKHKPIDKS